MAKKRKIDGDEFLSTYMEFVGKNGRLPKNFTSFLKRHKVENDERSAITSFKELNRQCISQGLATGTVFFHRSYR